MRSVLGILSVVVAARPNNAFFSDEDNAQLPRLFHLDDSDRCLMQKNGLYCLGELNLSPFGTSKMYENIKKYSSDVAAFNRSRLYRGYCVSERCPHQTMTLTNASQRFEECVNKRAKRHALTARLHTLKYCVTEQQHKERATKSPDTAQQLFLRVVYALLVLNVVGTVYDITTGDEKNRLIVAWSVRNSWRRLTAVYDEGDPRLKQFEIINGIRVAVILVTIYCHSWIQHYQFYVTSPQNLEIVYRRFDGIILGTGTSIIQWFVVLSSFLTAYNMLIYSENHPLSFLMLPVLVLKRIIRIAPVHLMLVGFAATYWPAMRSGALSPVIGELGATCRQKFWSHFFFISNVVDKEDYCLVPSWFLSVDMHLFILSCALTITVSRWRHLAVRLYLALFVLSSLFSGAVAYVTGWQTAVFFSTADNIRGIFRNTPSFSGHYTATWGALPACFAGHYLAHLHYELQQRKFDWNQEQWLRRVRPWILPGAVYLTYLLGVTLREYPQRWVTALCVFIERPLYASCLCLFLLALINFEGPQRRFFGWRGWRVPARLSLPVTLCHWIVSVAIAARPVTYYTSPFDVSIDCVATIVFGYALSVPIALLVEIPVQRFFAQMFISLTFKWFI